MIAELAIELYESSVDAEAALRQFILALGGLRAIITMIYVVWYVRHNRSGRLVLLSWQVSYVMLALLTTEHVYSHLQADDAPAWQLLSAVVGFLFGIVGLVSLMSHGAKWISTKDQPLP